MSRIIKADMYRILRGKAFYITCAIFVMMVFMSTIVGSDGVIGLSISSEKENAEVERSTAEGEMSGEVLTGSTMPFHAMQSTGDMIYFLLPFLVCLVAVDFSRGCIKNVLSAGVSRMKFYFAKLILHSTFCAGGLLLIVLLSMGLGTIYNGFGSSFDMGKLLQVFALQLLYLIAIGNIGIALAFILQKTSRVNVAYLATFILPQFVLMLIMINFPQLPDITYMELSQGINKLVNAAQFDGSMLGKVVIVGTIYIAVSLGLGISIFQKSEIK